MKTDVDVIPAVTATYDNPPADVNVYLRMDDSRLCYKGPRCDRNGKSAGTNIIQYGNHGGDNQIWKLVKNDGGSYTFISNNSGMALDYVGARCQNFTNVAIWTPNGSYAQKFVLEKI